MRFVTDEEVKQSLTMAKAIDLMEEAFVQLASGQATVPVRTVFPIAGQDASALTMPAYLSGSDIVGLKMITVHPENRDRGLPTSHATIVVSEGSTGKLLGVLEAEALTAIRTGAGSGLATKLLAIEDARVVVIFGAGRQAETQLEAVCCVRPIERAYVFNRTQANAERFVDMMSEPLGVEIFVGEDRAVVREADVICTATPSLTSLFGDNEIKPGVHINGVGSYRPDMVEIPGATVARAKVVVDHRAACLAEAGDLLQPIASGLIQVDHIVADLGEVAMGEPRVREAADDITFFKSVGNAVQDLICAKFTLDTVNRV